MLTRLRGRIVKRKANPKKSRLVISNILLGGMLGLASSSMILAGPPAVAQDSAQTPSNLSMGETEEESTDLKKAITQKKLAAPKKVAKKRVIVEKLGAFKGRIRDAGKFKTEMVTKRSGVDIYLLNKQAQSPAVKGSSITGNLYVGSEEYALKFWPNRRRKRFYAKWPKGVSVGEKNLSLVILPTRKRVIGAPVVYKMKQLY